MAQSYISKVREASRVAFCQDFGLPLNSTSEEIEASHSITWLAFQAGFISGCQFQLTESKAVVDTLCLECGVSRVLATHASLPDGP